MDATALVLIIVSAGFYLFAKAKPDLQKFLPAAYIVLGFGFGMLVSAFWAASIISKAFGG